MICLLANEHSSFHTGMHMREKTKSFASSSMSYIKANFGFILIILFIIAGALLSATYAFLRADNSRPTPQAAATEIAVQKYEHLASVEVIPVQTPDTPQDNHTDTAPPAAPESPATLGVSVDCAQVNSRTGKKVLSLQERLNSLLSSLTIKRLYAEVLAAYDVYSGEVRAQGCAPTLPKPLLPFR